MGSMMERFRFLVALILLAAVCGCGEKPVTRVDTGARAVAQEFCQALVDRQWKAAYDLLNVDSRWPLAYDDFVYRAEVYRYSVGFEPKRVRISSCEEKEDRAVAHALFRTASPHHRRQAELGLVLKKVGEVWRVVLPNNFGHRR